MSDVIRTANPEGVVNLQGLAQAKSQQDRVENMQRRLLAAQLTAQVLANSAGPSEGYLENVLNVFDKFLKAAE